MRSCAWLQRFFVQQNSMLALGKIAVAERVAAVADSRMSTTLGALDDRLVFNLICEYLCVGTDISVDFFFCLNDYPKQRLSNPLATTNRHLSVYARRLFRRNLRHDLDYLSGEMFRHADFMWPANINDYRQTSDVLAELYLSI